MRARTPARQSAAPSTPPVVSDMAPAPPDDDSDLESWTERRGEVRAGDWRVRVTYYPTEPVPTGTCAVVRLAVSSPRLAGGDVSEDPDGWRMSSTPDALLALARALREAATLARGLAAPEVSQAAA